MLHRVFRHQRGLRKSTTLVWLPVALLALLVSQSVHSRAQAHDMGGLFQPTISDLVIESSSAPDGTREVWTRIVDADSGRPAEGVLVITQIGDQAVELPEISAGFYDGNVKIPAGDHPVKLTVTSNPGGALVRKYEKSWTAKVPAGDGRVVLLGAGRRDELMAAEQSPLYARRLAAAKEGADIQVNIEEPADADKSQPLFVHLVMKTVSRSTGKPVTTEYRLYGYAVDAAGNQTDSQEFNPLDVVDPGRYPPGVYGGLIILPRGGQWKIHADALALKKAQNDPPLHVAQGEITIQRESAVSLSATTAAERAAKPKANAFNEVVLAIHTLAAGAWAGLLGILVLFTFRRAKFLSTWGRNVIEQHLDSIIRSVFVATLIIIVTGVFNVYRESPYKLTSPDRISKVLNLPFGRPYFLALVIKLTAYGVLLAESAYLVRRVRLSTRIVSRAQPASGRSGPWGASMTTLSVGRRAESSMTSRSIAGSGAGTTMVAEQEADSCSVPADSEVGKAAKADGDVTKRSDRGFEYLLLPSMVLLGTVLVCAVTVLKAAHLLIEVARLTP
jgi:hypothetical protein